MTPKPKVDVDVVVVGAGLSGLRAAVDIQNSGLSCVVLEAMDRVGGKTLSVMSSPGSDAVSDLGAAWINDTNQSRMYAMALKYKFKLEPQRAEGLDLYLQADGSVAKVPYGESLLNDKAAAAVRDFFQLIDELGAKLVKESYQGNEASQLDALTLAEFCDLKFKVTAVKATANSLITAFLGVDAGDMSMLHFIKYVHSGTGIMNMISDQKDGGQYLRNHSGMQSFSKCLVSELKEKSVFLNSPVMSIDQSSEGICTVASRDHKFSCRKVIIPIPTTLLPKIEFSPDLPPTKKLLSESTVMGYYAKTIFVFAEPWWRSLGLSGNLEASDGPICFSRDTCIFDRKQYSITCFIVGERGRQWSKLSKHDRTAQVHGQFNKMMGSMTESRLPEPINIIEQEWIKHEWFLGAPSPVMVPGFLTSAAGRSLREPYKNLHFVGTETSDVWEGYMEGAVRSGERGAAEVIAQL